MARMVRHVLLLYYAIRCTNWFVQVVRALIVSVRLIMAEVFVIVHQLDIGIAQL